MHVAQRAQAVLAARHVGPGGAGVDHVEPLVGQPRRDPVQQLEVLARQVGAHREHVLTLQSQARAQRPGSGGEKNRSSTPSGTVAVRSGATPRCSDSSRRTTSDAVSTSRALLAARGSSHRCQRV